MSTEKQRALNRAKQKRFQQRHPKAVKQKYERQKKAEILNPTEPYFRASFRTFELVDPRGSSPRIIGYCQTTVKPVWSALWFVRKISRSPWAAWLRQLDALYLQPKEQFGWATGLVIPLTAPCAKLLVDMRIRQINKAATGSEIIAPCWLLRIWGKYHYPLPAGVQANKRGHAIGRVHVSGQVERFRTIISAARSTGIAIPMIYNYVATVATRNGWTWFDDGDGSARNISGSTL